MTLLTYILSHPQYVTPGAQPLQESKAAVLQQFHAAPAASAADGQASRHHQIYRYVSDCLLVVTFKIMKINFK